MERREQSPRWKTPLDPNRGPPGHGAFLSGVPRLVARERNNERMEENQQTY